MKVLLKIEGLTFTYPQRTLFTNLCAEFPCGVSLIQGGDGQGKTTLLRILAGDVVARHTALTANGVALDQQPDRYRQQVFWADARDARFDQLTPAQVFDEMQRRYPAFDAVAVRPLMEGLSLTEHQHKRLFMLSTGSRRKVFLAAAFASGAPVVLLDSPFAALDKPSIQFVKDCLAAFSRSADRACVVADYEAPEGVDLAGVVDLG